MEPTPPPTGPPTTIGDMLRAALVVTFAFLVVSFPAQNTDVWRHLATGRALVTGEYRFGIDPFSYTTPGATWVNHAWLFDVAAFGLYQACGGAGLAVAKALLGAVLSACLVYVCWRGPQRWLALLLIVLGLTAASPFVVLRPVCVSLLFVGVTYAWLERRPSVTFWRASVPLLIMFAVWANTDDWFVLGPGLVALWWLGGLVTRSRQTAGTTVRAGAPLVCVALAGLAVALLNPHHVRAFTVPALLDPGIAEDWLNDDGDRAALRSPLALAVAWSGDHATTEDHAKLRQPARVAYMALALLSLLSFVAQGRNLQMGRLLVWLALLGLSVYRSGAIPF